MNSRNEELLAVYVRNLGESPHRGRYLTYAKAFLDYAEDRPLDKEVVSGFLRNQQRKGRGSAHTQAHLFGLLRRLYTVNKIEWPFRRGEGPLQSAGKRRPALNNEQILEMIRATDRFLPEESAFLALSTTYGLRRIEMVNLEPEHLDFEGRTIFITTAKGGVQRRHSLPDNILPWLQAHDWSRGFSGHDLNKIYKVITYRMGWPDAKGINWHNIRESLATALDYAGLPEVAVNDFLRWKRQGMVQHYHATEVFSYGSTKAQPIMSKVDLDADRKVFEVHPFLPEWGRLTPPGEPHR